jgi:hypothetical protein
MVGLPVMIIKLLFTLGVIGVAWLALHNRSRSALGSLTTQSPERQRQGGPRLAAYVLVVCMILASGVILYLQWRDEYRIVTVRVINTRTDRVISYEARRGDVDARQFQTLDGRTVNVSEIERIEIGGNPP